MPRKGGVVKRPVPQDLKYNDVLVSRFINGLMERGKKARPSASFITPWS